jgi:hypothetical protein
MVDAGHIALALAAQGIVEDTATVRVAIDGTASLVFAAGVGQTVQDAALAILDSLDLSAQGEAARQAIRNRTDAVDDFQQSTPLGQILRAEVLVMVDEINLLRAWITSFKAATAAAASLADLKTRIAALDNLPQRTAVQAKNAVVAKAQDTNTDA